MDTLSSVEAALSVLSSARGTSSDLAAGRRQRKAETARAYEQFAQVTSRAIVSAEYFATLGRVTRNNQRQMLTAVATTAGVDLWAQRDGTARALQPLTRIAFGYGLASELVTLGSVRVDLRALFALLEDMVAASNSVHDLAPDEVRMAAEQVVEGIGELFRRLPNLDKPMRRALAAWGGHDDAVAYQEALARAWRQHRSFRAATQRPPSRWARMRHWLIPSGHGNR